MAVAASAPSLASLLTQETGSDGVLITGGVVVRVHSCFRSFLSPDFFLNTGLALKPDVDFTFDLEVCDGVEKATVTLHPDLSVACEVGLIERGVRVVLDRVTVHRDAASSRKPRLGVLVHSLRFLERQPRNVELGALDAEKGIDIVPGHDYMPAFADDAFDALPSWEAEATKYEKLKPVVLDLHVDEPKQRASESTAEVVARIKAHSDETDEVTLPYPCAPFRGDPADNEGRVFKLPLIADSLAAQNIAMLRGRKRFRADYNQGGKSILDDIDDEDLDGDLGTMLDRAERSGTLDALAAAGDATSQPSLLGRLCVISRIRWHGAAGRSEELPLSFEFIINDRSRNVRVTAWNGAALRWHRALSRVPLGTLIAVTNYRFRLAAGEPDISLNASGPEGLVTAVLPQMLSLFPLDAFPAPALRLTTDINTVAGFADGAHVSFAGLVMRIGPVCRTPIYDDNFFMDGARMQRTDAVAEDSSAGWGAGAGPAAPQVRRLRAVMRSQLGPLPSRGIWYSYRWVWLLGPYSLKAIPVKLYTNSNAKLLQQDGALKLGKALVVFDARVVKCSADDDAAAHPSVYLTSSKYTRAISNEAADGGLSRPIYELEPNVDARSALVLKKFVDWCVMAAGGDFDKTFARSRGGRSLRFLDEQKNPLASTLTRPPSLSAYVAFLLRGFVARSASAGVADSPGDGAAGATMDDSGDDTALESAAPCIGVAELVAIRDGNADFSRALTAANAASAIGVVSGVPTGATATTPAASTTSCASLWHDRFVLLQNMQVVRAVVRARVVAVLRIVGDGQSGHEAAGLISATTIRETLDEDLSAPFAEEDHAARKSTTPLASYALKLTDVAAQGQHAFVLLNDASLLPHSLQLGPLPDKLSDGDARQLACLRSFFPPSTPCSSFAEFTNYIMAKGREYAFCVTVHKTEASSSEILGASLADGVKSTSRLRRGTVRVEAIYED